MTSRQREDLYIKWSFCGTHRQDILKRKYQRQYGTARDEKHWEIYIAGKLGLVEYWKQNGIH